jgi:hypothetical protein
LKILGDLTANNGDAFAYTLEFWRGIILYLPVGVKDRFNDGDDFFLLDNVFKMTRKMLPKTSG